MRRASTPDFEDDARSRDAYVRRLSQAFVTDEAMAALRHDLLSHLTGIGTVTYLLRKHVDHGELPATEPINPPRERRGGDLLRMIKEQVTEATAKLQRRLVAPPDRAFAEAPLKACAARARASLVNPEGVVVTLMDGDDAREGRGDCSFVAAANDIEVEIAMACLFENAIEAATASSREADGARPAVVRVTFERVRCDSDDEGQIACVVDDSGRGFGATESARAFDAFYTTKPSRLGLGLTVARRIAQRWGGSVVLAGSVAGGNRVALQLPALGVARRAVP